MKALDELELLPQWVCWNADPNPGQPKPKKVPYRPDGRGRASSTEPASWGTLTTALDMREACGYTGTGFVFTAADPYCGIDLDNCIVEGVVSPEALDIVRRLDSYTEISWSGTGLHIILRGRLPAGKRRKGPFEVYDSGRYFTFSASQLDGTPDTINDRQAELDALYAERFPAEESPAARIAVPPTAITPDDDELLQRLLQSRGGGKFERLFSGDTSLYDHDDSAADIALCNILAWWCRGDTVQMDRLFRRSGLLRDKWDERRGSSTYGQQTIEQAIAYANTDGPADRHIPIPFTPRVVNPEASTPLTAAAMLGPALADRFPAPPDEAIYRGLAGDFVRLINPHTEADPVALLIQLLVAYGNCIGRSAHFTAEADRHYTNIYAVLVGATAKGRKGSSLGQVRRLFGIIDPTWAQTRIQEGQSSGEGLIWAVRDPIRKRVEVLEGKRKTGEYRDEVIDDGVPDKRLLCAESEFASLLRQFEREGNTLSAVLRQAWDSGMLRALTKNSQAAATGAHISEIGHITADELHRYLLRTEVANGLGNRFLWLCVKRSKVLPEGGNIETVDFGDLCRDLQAAIEFGMTAGELRRDPDARVLWHQVYPDLSEGKPGMAGSLTARAEAQVMRLALLYALLDLSAAIQLPHLQAALALWGYCDASVKAVFQSAIGDPVADAVLDALRDSPEGIPRTQLTRLFQRWASSGELDRALETLNGKYLVQRESVSTGGRSADVYRVRSVNG